MLYQDKYGRVFSDEDINSMPFWKIEMLEFHMAELGEN